MKNEKLNYKNNNNKESSKNIFILCQNVNTCIARPNLEVCVIQYRTNLVSLFTVMILELI